MYIVFANTTIASVNCMFRGYSEKPQFAVVIYLSDLNVVDGESECNSLR